MSDIRGNRPSRRALLMLPPLALGVLVLAWMAAGRQAPVRAERAEPIRAVRVVEVLQLDLVPRVEGYGAVQPARVWTAVAQVAGRVVEIHPQLRDGEILPADARLLRIDPVDYELALAQAQAELDALEVEEGNTRASLDIEERNLVLAQRDFERKRGLVGKGSASQGAADESERAMLAARNLVQSLENTLALIPARQRLLEAKVERAERDLEHTLIRAPFSLRVAELAVEADQYVSVGQRLFEGDAVDRVEIEAQMAMSSLRRLFLGRPDVAPDPSKMTESLSEVLGLRPQVRLDLGGHLAEWDAEFVRFDDAVDPRTRSIGVVVAVDKPFDKVLPGERPPLSKGMFVQVVLRGKSQEQRLVVPRSAVRRGAVYLADADDRLRRRPVRVLFSQGRLSTIAEGLAAGERVVVSDLVPAAEGMLLEPRPDKGLMAEMEADAAGGS